MLKIHHAKLTESRVALIQLFIHGSCSNGHEKILSKEKSNHDSREKKLPNRALPYTSIGDPPPKK